MRVPYLIRARHHEECQTHGDRITKCEGEVVDEAKVPHRRTQPTVRTVSLTDLSDELLGP